MRLSLLLAALTLSWASTVFAQPNMPSGMGNPPYNQGVCNPNGNNPYAEEGCDSFRPTVTETYTADCTKDSGAFKRTLARIGPTNDGIVGVQVVGECEVDPFLRVSARNILIGGQDENGDCSGRLVNRDSAFFQIVVANGALVGFSCLELDVIAQAVRLDSTVNSFFSFVGITAPPLQLIAFENSSLRLTNNNTSIQFISSTGQSRVYTSGTGFAEQGAYLQLRDSSDLTSVGGTGRIGTLDLDNGSSADLQTIQRGSILDIPPEIDRAFIRFGSRLRTTSPVLNLTVDDSSVAITPDLGP